MHEAKNMELPKRWKQKLPQKTKKNTERKDGVWIPIGNTQKKVKKYNKTFFSSKKNYFDSFIYLFQSNNHKKLSL